MRKHGDFFHAAFPAEKRRPIGRLPSPVGAPAGMSAPVEATDRKKGSARRALPFVVQIQLVSCFLSRVMSAPTMLWGSTPSYSTAWTALQMGISMPIRFASAQALAAA